MQGQGGLQRFGRLLLPAELDVGGGVLESAAQVAAKRSIPPAGTTPTATPQRASPVRSADARPGSRGESKTTRRAPSAASATPSSTNESIGQHLSGLAAPGCIPTRGDPAGPT